MGLNNFGWHNSTGRRRHFLPNEWPTYTWRVSYKSFRCSTLKDEPGAVQCGSYWVKRFDNENEAFEFASGYSDAIVSELVNNREVCVWTQHRKTGKNK